MGGGGGWKRRFLAIYGISSHGALYGPTQTELCIAAEYYGVFSLIGMPALLSTRRTGRALAVAKLGANEIGQLYIS